jgi:hypothetical protein
MLIWKDASSFQNLQHAFPGQGQMKPKQLEIERRRREVNKLKAERDIPIKAAAYFAKCSVTRRTPARTNIQITSDAANRFPRDWRESATRCSPSRDCRRANGRSGKVKDADRSVLAGGVRRVTRTVAAEQTLSDATSASARHQPQSPGLCARPRLDRNRHGPPLVGILEHTNCFEQRRTGISKLNLGRREGDGGVGILLDHRERERAAQFGMTSA